MNDAERQILSRAIQYLSSSPADAMTQGLGADDWEKVAKGKAIEDLEILQLLSGGVDADLPYNAPVEIDVPRI